MAQLELSYIVIRHKAVGGGLTIEAANEILQEKIEQFRQDVESGAVSFSIEPLYFERGGIATKEDIQEFIARSRRGEE
jgi:hypothetical protein